MNVDNDIDLSDIATELDNKISQQRVRNDELTRLYDGTYVPSMINVLNFPQNLLERIDTGLGWGKIIVDTIAERLEIVNQFDPTVLSSIEVQNAAVDIHQAALKYGRSFALLHDREDGPVQIIPRSPVNTAVLYGSDGAAEAALAVEGDFTSRVASLYLPDRRLTLKESGAVFYVVDEHPARGIPVVEFNNVSYQPEISHSIKGLMHSASASLTFAKLNEEIYSLPQWWVVGAGPNDFRDPDTGELKNKWQARFDALFLLEGTDEQTNQPKVGEFSTHYSDGFMRTVESLALQVAAEAGIPTTYFGVSSPQATSAEAIAKLEGRLVRKVEARQRRFSPPWQEVIKAAYAIKRISAPEVSIAWGNAQSLPLSATADAVVKLVGEKIIPADSEAALSMLGLPASVLEQLRKDRQSSRIADLLNDIVSPAITDTAEQAEEG